MKTAAIEASVQYLRSPAALASLQQDCYWPKWDSPWWHMLALHEMGEGGRIPAETVEAMIASLNRVPLKIFPIHPEDNPEGFDLTRESFCHCGVGCMYQVLHACGVDVDARLPWMRPWFLRYQMEDGGLTCDNKAYLVRDECPSSMVGTIAPFEAVLLCTSRPYTPEEIAFLDRAAQFLIERQLTKGSRTVTNAEERLQEPDWLKPCFPRFYKYDVMRGLTALLKWAEVRQKAVPEEAVAAVMSHLSERFPDGQVRLERLSYEGVRSVNYDSSDGTWKRGAASLFPLLEEVSKLGQVSPVLTRDWQQALRVRGRSTSG
jgi:hypothetical protein